MGQMFPPIEHCLQSMQRAEAAGWDFIDFPDQIQSTHPLGMLKNPQPQSDPSLPTSLWHDAWYGSMEMCSVASVLTSKIGIFLGVIDALRRSPAVMAQEMATISELSKGRARFAIAAGEEKQFQPYGEDVQSRSRGWRKRYARGTRCGRPGTERSTANRSSGR
jgi:phthiodiolone/phenolphthiodiolone dimycocerosates ketoreductase